MRNLSLVGVTVIGFMGLMAGWVKFQETYGLFYPAAYPERRLENLPPSIDFVEFRSTDETTLTGLFKQGSTDAPVMVFAHGNAGHMINRLQWFRTALPDTWSGLILDYRGYGLSAGSPTVAGLKNDVRAATEYALDTTGTDRLVLHGRSLGVPMVAHAAQHVAPDAMILESGFATAGEVASDILPIPGVGYLVTVRLNTVEYLRAAQEKHGDIPKFILHGTRDRVLPINLGRSLYRQAPPPKQWWEVEGAGHNDLTYVAGEAYRTRVLNFLEDQVGRSSNKP